MWIQIHNLPPSPNIMNGDNIRKVGNVIGTLSFCEEEHQLCNIRNFVHIKAHVNINKPLTLGCFIKREDGSKLWIVFKYERAFEFYYRCGMIDHVEPACSCPWTSEVPCPCGPWTKVVSLGTTKPVPTTKNKDNLIDKKEVQYQPQLVIEIGDTKGKFESA